MVVRVASPKALGVPTLSARLRTAAGNVRNPHLPRHDPYHGQAVGMICDSIGLFKHPLSTKYKDETLSFLSYQSPDKIIAGYALIGHSHIFDEVAAIWPSPRTTSQDLKGSLANYVKRRNQIAHEGDRDYQGRARAMQPQYAKQCKEFVVNLVSKLNRVVYDT